MDSGSVVEVAIASVLIAASMVLVVFSRMTYRMIDATAGRTAEKWARAGADASWRMYHWQRPLLRWASPLVLLLTGIVFLVDGLS